MLKVKRIYNQIRNLALICFSTPPEWVEHVQMQQMRLQNERRNKATKASLKAQQSVSKTVHTVKPSLNFLFITSYICELCSFPTTTRQAMELHKMSHQTQIKESDLKYRCDRCDYKTYRSYSLKVSRSRNRTQEH